MKDSMKYITAKTTLTAYASDASIYAVDPVKVRHIRTDSDVIDAVSGARRENISITPRGGGTGLAGGAVGSGLILDFGLYREVLEIDADSRMVRAQVGILYDELNLALKRFRLFFPPDPSSGDSCQIGGMIANNSSGPRSVKYGLTTDFVEELGVVLAGGEKVTLKKMPLNSDELKLFYKANPQFQEIHRIIGINSGLIKERWPKLKKNSAGYNLYQVVRDMDNGIANWPALMVGSEGTLALFLDAKLRLLPVPVRRLTLRAYFKSLVSAGKAVESILKLAPSGLEIVDGSTLDIIGRGNYGIPNDASALLLIEFDENIEIKKGEFAKIAHDIDLAAPIDFADDPKQAALLWRARRAIVPTLYRHHPTRRPIPLVEDISVPPDKIPDFIEYITDLFDSYDLTYGIFGHIGDGNLHIRPLFDMNDSREFQLACNLYEKVYDKVIAIGGSTTAEHADGRLRAGLLKKLYGDAIFNLFGQIKAILDPKNILSPDSSPDLAVFIKDIDFEKLKSFCAACGKCNGYCPAYDIFRGEDFSPRGWLRILNQSGASRAEINKHLSYCLNCKNCTAVCPAGVDIAGEILAFRGEKPSVTARMIAGFAGSDSLLGLSMRLGKLIEPIIGQSGGLPRMAAKSMRQRFSDRIADQGEVAYFHGCADNLFESNVGAAVFKVFDNLGIRLSLPDQKCCGLPYEVYGLRDNLVAKAKFNIDKLSNFGAIITGCASCLLRLKEYMVLFKDDPDYRSKAEKLANNSYEICHYLNTIDMDYSKFRSNGKTKVTYHNPCHLRAAGLHDEPEKLMAKIDGVELIHPLYADRCCGQAGSYGYTHGTESRKIFSTKKKDYLELEAEYLMTSCPSCQMKIRSEMGDKFKVVHPIEILAARLGSS